MQQIFTKAMQCCFNLLWLTKNKYKFNYNQHTLNFKLNMLKGKQYTDMVVYR